MDKKITAEELIEIVKKHVLDPTIKDIIIRDIRNEGLNEFLVDQVIAYCDKTIEELQNQTKNPS